MNIYDKYREAERLAGFKPGQRVKILRTAETDEDGWEQCWEPDMDKLVGTEATVITGTSQESYNCGVYTKPDFSEDNVWFPYFVLEKVTQKEQQPEPEEEYF